MIYINSKQQVDEAVAYVKSTLAQELSNGDFKTGIILGSGQSGFIKHIKVLKSINFADIPHLPLPTGALHPGKLVLAEIEGEIRDEIEGKMGDSCPKNLCKVIVSLGRLHPYDGLNAHQVVFPLELMAHIGIENVILCNASGAINPHYKVGDLFLLKDHINFTGMNPLLPAKQSADNERSDLPVFPPMEGAYSPELTELINKTAQSMGIGALELSTYIGVLGPSFETPAEIKAFATLGADLVGMSTVLEVIAAAALQVRCATIALNTNMAAGVTNETVSVNDIMSNAGDAVEKLYSLLKAAVLSIENGFPPARE